MGHIRIISLYSGSEGNSTLIETDSTSVLIDAGKSARALNNALRAAGSDIGRISSVFITHEHTDHVSALGVLVKKHPIPVHITEQSARNLHLPENSVLPRCLCLHKPVFTETVGDLTVSSFPVSHDSAMCVGYRITAADGFTFGIATDTGYVTDAISDNLIGCDAAEVESNHNVGMLKCGSYPQELKCRILSRTGHLSNDDCSAFLCRLAANGTKYFLLAHLSRENNNPESALATAKGALAHFDDVRICVAKPEEQTILVNI